MTKVTPPQAMPMQTRLAAVGDINAETRTVSVVFTTGAAVRRRRYVGWDSAVPFDEVLLVSDDAVNLTRLQAGAPALDSHSAYSTSSQVGVVENPRIEKGQGIADIRFPSAGVDPAADRMFALVDQRIIRNISVGYSIDEVEVKAPAKAGDIEQRIIKRWTPMEISFVTVPADPGAQVRATDPLFSCAVTAPEGDGGVAVAAARMRMRQKQITL
jgi:hypothetical protein